MSTISELVKETMSTFQYYRDGELWYRIPYSNSGLDSVKKHFDFPIPITDTGTGVFEKQMKSIVLMRWIRKHLDTLAKWEKERVNA